MSLLAHVLKNPRQGWDFDYLSRNPNISLNEILDHPELGWSWDNVCLNPGITLEQIKAHPECRWNRFFLSCNRAVTIDFVLGFPNDLNDSYEWNMWSYTNLLNYSKVTCADLLAHPELEWGWYHVYKCPELTLDYVLEHPEKRWDWWKLCKHLKVTLEQVKSHPEVPWDYVSLSKNPLGWVNYAKPDKSHRRQMHQVTSELLFMPEGRFGTALVDGGLEWQNQKKALGELCGG